MTVVVRRLEGKMLVSMERALSFIERDKYVCSRKIMNDSHVKFCFDCIKEIDEQNCQTITTKKKKRSKNIRGSCW